MAKQHAPRGPIKTRVGGDDLMDAVDRMDRARCSATSKQSGVRCKRRPIPGGAVCVMHGGGAPQVKQAAMERLRALQHPAIDALEWLIVQRDFPSASYSAARDVLDRTEGKPAETVDMNVSGDAELIAALYAGRKRAADARKDQ